MPLGITLERNGVELNLADLALVETLSMYTVKDFYHIPGTLFYVISHFNFSELAKFTIGKDFTYDISLPLGIPEYGKSLDHVFLYDTPLGRAYNVREAFHTLILSLIRERVDAGKATDICNPRHVLKGAMHAGMVLYQIAEEFAPGNGDTLWCGDIQYHVMVTYRPIAVSIPSNASKFLHSWFKVRLNDGEWVVIGSFDETYNHYMTTVLAEIASKCSAQAAQAQADDSWRGKCGLPHE